MDDESGGPAAIQLTHSKLNLSRLLVSWTDRGELKLNGIADAG